jgi:hypothetical protein
VADDAESIAYGIGCARVRTTNLIAQGTRKIGDRGVQSDQYASLAHNGCITPGCVRLVNPSFPRCAFRIRLLPKNIVLACAPVQNASSPKMVAPCQAKMAPLLFWVIPRRIIQTRPINDPTAKDQYLNFQKL